MINVENRDKYFLLVFSLMVIASGFDLTTDVSHGAPLEHVIKEAMLLGISLFAVLWLVLDLRRQQQEIARLRQVLQQAKQPDKQPDQYVLDARKRLADVISQQFNDWGLSRSEQEVGWFLLKGLSLKEIALLRETLEKTVRQQASSIYNKAGISGRHTFSAWFIEDIL